MAVVPHDTGTESRVDERHFRTVLGHFPTGVTVVTSMTADGPVGMAIGAFTSVSLDPPLVGLLPAQTSRTWPRIAATGRFCVNVLGAGQEDLSRTFSRSDGDRFAGLGWRPAPWSGAPVLNGVAAWIDCAVASTTPAGDHRFVLGRVHALRAVEGTDPLVFLHGKYRALHP